MTARLRRLVMAWALTASGSLPASVPAAEAPPGQQGATAPAPATPAVTLRVDRQRVTVGDPIEVTIEIRYPEGTEVSALAPGADWGGLRTLEVMRGTPQPHPQGGWVRSDRVRVAAFTPGAAKAPPLEVEYRGMDGRIGRISTPPFEISVDSILVKGEAPEISDLKDPASLSGALWPWVLGAAAVAAAAAGGAWTLARRRRRLAEALARRQDGPPLPAHEWALQKLAALSGSDMLAAGHWLEYHVILSEVLKEYLARRYGIPTLERTTSEVLAEARERRLGGGLVADLRSVLEPCDLVKFARRQPARADSEATLGRARAFVETTRPVEMPQPTASAQAAGS